jgi:hypothetical protein
MHRYAPCSLIISTLVIPLGLEESSGESVLAKEANNVWWSYVLKLILLSSNDQGCLSKAPINLKCKLSLAPS